MGDERRALAGVVLRFLQLLDHFCKVVHHLAAGLFHLGDAALEVLQPQPVGVLDLPCFIGGGLDHLARLRNGLLARKLVDGLGLEVCILEDLVGIVPGLLADARGIALGLGNDLIAVRNDLLAGLVMGAALDPQRRVCLLTLLGQLLVFPHKVAVFQAQHIQLVCQRVVALLRGGILRFQIGAVALQLVHLPGQRCILGRKVLVLHHKGLGMTAQGVILLPDGAQLGSRRCKVLLIIGTKLPHCLTHIVRLIPAEARLAHTALLYVVVDVNFGHW